MNTDNFHKLKVWSLVLISTLGMLEMGYILGVLNTLMQYFTNDVYNFTAKQKESSSSILNAIMTLGAIVGALSAGPLAKKFGRRPSIIFIDIVVMISAAITLVPKLEVFIIGRAIAGFTGGFNTSLTPLYVAEITPLKIKGIAGTMNQIQAVFGVFLAVLFGLALPESDFTGGRGQWWRLMLGFPILVALIRLLFILFVFKTDTPKHYVYSGNKEKAEEALRMIYKKEFVSEQLQAIEQTRKEEEKGGKITFRQLFTRHYRKRVVMGCFIAFLQQMTGINAFMFYSTDIFSNGRSAQTGVLLSVIFNLVSVLASCFSGQIVKRFGRKTILIWGDITITLSIIVTAILFWKDALGGLIYPIYIFIILFGLSYGPITWIIIPEILPDIGIGLAVFFTWFGTFLIALLFPILSNKDVIGPGMSFAIFFIFDILALPIIIYFFKETRGLTNAQINDLYTPKGLQTKRLEIPQIEEPGSPQSEERLDTNNVLVTVTDHGEKF